MPTVSIVIPTYNRVNLLRQTLDSALAQTFRDIEIIVVDNASEDATAEMMAEYSQRDSRVRYVRKPVNKGMVDSYNMGYRLSRGEYVHFLDSDDLATPEATAIRVEQLDRNPDIDLVYTRYFYIDAGGRKLYLSERPPIGDENALRHMLRYPFVQMNSALMRRKVAGVTPEGPYDQAVPAGASDWHFLLTLLLNGSRIRGLDTPTLLYRIHPGNHTRNIAGFERDMKKTHDWVFNDPRLPMHLAPMKEDSLESQYLWFSSGYYFNGDYENGKRSLQVAWRLRPEWHAAPDMLIMRLAGLANNPWMLDPMPFIEGLHAHPPEEIEWLKQPWFTSKLRARVHVNMALRALDWEDPESFRQLVLQAFEEDPGLKRDARGFNDTVAQYAQHSISDNPHWFVKHVSRALPAAAQTWVKRNELLGTFHIVDAFAQYNRGNYREVIADATAVSMHLPRRMLNRGMLSIVRKSFNRLARQSLHHAA